jgi:aminoglycoside phosphotransferase (APT) family kinase protein
MAPILGTVRVLAEGRASEILELGDGRVLRRFKAGGRPAREAEVMEHARAHGYPVPGVVHVLDDALVLERVDGRTMLADLRRRPWAIASHARTLAELHAQLHEIPFEGERLIHLDFHPDNVLLSSRGPVVIDWANSRAGEPALDVAMTWVICATSGGAMGRLFTRFFLRHVDLRAARTELAAAGELRIADPNVTDDERERVRRLTRIAP